MPKRLFEMRVKLERDLRAINMWLVAEVMEVLWSPKRRSKLKKSTKEEGPGHRNI